MCCVMPPLSRLATSMPMILSNSEVLPWSTWPRNVIDGGPGDQVGRIVLDGGDGRELLLGQRRLAVEVDFGPHFDGQQLGGFRLDHGIDRGHGADAQQCFEHLLGGDAHGLGKAADGARQSERDFALAGGGSVGAAGGATVPHQAATANRRRFALFVPSSAGGFGGTALAIQLALFAIAQQVGRGFGELRSAFRFLRRAFRGRARRRPRAGLGRGREGPRAIPSCQRDEAVRPASLSASARACASVPTAACCRSGCPAGRRPAASDRVSAEPVPAPSARARAAGRSAWEPIWGITSGPVWGPPAWAPRPRWSSCGSCRAWAFCRPRRPGRRSLRGARPSAREEPRARRPWWAA